MNIYTPHKPNELRRSRLIARATQAGPLVFVGAGIGYGKTVLLTQVAEALEKSGLKGEVITFDSSSIQVEESIAQSLKRLWRSKKIVEDVLEGSPIETSRNDSFFEPIFLLLDKYENVRSEGSDEWLCTLSARLPSGSAVLVAGRFLEDARIRWLKNHYKISFIGTSEMRFTEEEVSQFLGNDTVKIKAPDIFGEINGWPTGIKIISSHNGGTPEQTNELSTPKIREDLRDYFLFSKIEISANLAEIVLQLSITPNITYDSLKTLSRRPDVSSDLTLLETFGLASADKNANLALFTPFRHFSLEYLSKDFPEIYDKCIRRSVKHFISSHQISMAQSILSISSIELAREVLEEAGGWMLGVRFGPALLNDFHFPSLQEFKKYPRLGLAKAIHLARAGLIEEARGLYEHLAGMAIPQHNAKIWKAELIINDARISLFADNDFDSAKITDLHAAIKMDLGDTPELYAIANGILSDGLYRLGHYQQARDVGLRSLALCDHYNVPYTKSYVYSFTSMAEYRLGNIHEAISLGERMRVHVKSEFGKESPLNDLAEIVLACSYYEAGRFSEAETLLDKPLRDIIDQEHLLEIAAIGLMIAANIALQKRDSESALSILKEARDVGAKHNFPRLTQMAKCREVTLLSSLGQIDEARKIISHDDFPPRPKPSSADLWRDYVEMTALLSYTLFFKTDQKVDESRDYLDSFLSDPSATQNVPSYVRMLCLKVIVSAQDSRPNEIESTIRSLHLYAVKKGYVAPVSEIDLMGPALQKLISSHSLSADDRRLTKELYELYAYYTELVGDPTKSVHLSPRQLQILQLLSEGLSNKEIARRLDLAEGTVKSYRKSLYEKLNISSRSQAVSFARYFS